MQHPDEGTIHSWLDNALSAEEAAKLESHVAECPQCAAAVAEARGFIAASSRILTALDDVPRGVVPAVPARKRDFRVLWRAAAAVLVVAGGSLIVLRDGDQEMRSSSVVSDSAAVESRVPATVEAEGTVADADIAAAAPAAGSSQLRRASPPTARDGRGTASRERDLSATPTFGKVSAPTGTSTAQAGRVDTAASTSRAMQLSANAVSEQSELRPIRVVRIERSIGSRRTIYEVSPTDTVILTEAEPVFLSGVVTTGIAAAEDQQSKGRATRSIAPMRAEPAAAPPPPPPPVAPTRDARQSADTMKASTEATVMAKTLPAPAQAVALTTATVNTIRWNEAATGKTLTLSGKLSVEQLQEIKRRIEAERAAANKKP